MACVRESEAPTEGMAYDPALLAFQEERSFTPGELSLSGASLRLAKNSGESKQQQAPAGIRFQRIAMRVSGRKKRGEGDDAHG